MHNLTVKNETPRVILLDRDGVINQDSPEYIKSVDEFIFLPDSIDAIGLATRNGYRIGLATNQSGLSRGYYNKQVLDAIHDKMLVQIRKAGGDIVAIEYCPHLPSEDCICRKPSPGMLYTLSRRLNCSLTGIPFIGDKISDVQAAIACGAKPMVVLSSMTDRLALEAYPGVPVFNSLKHCIEHLLEPICTL
jgi:D-glycero-D-manno-heptose 1,7-bisphosphate phosphatase